MRLLYNPAKRKANRAAPPSASITAGLISKRLRVRPTAMAMAISPSPLMVSPSEITAAAIKPSTAGVSPRSAARTGRRERIRSSQVPAVATNANGAAKIPMVATTAPRASAPPLHGEQARAVGRQTDGQAHADGEEGDLAGRRIAEHRKEKRAGGDAHLPEASDGGPRHLQRDRADHADHRGVEAP